MDAGTGVIMFRGQAVGLHIDGAHSLRDQFERAEVIDMDEAEPPRWVKALERCVKAAVEPMAGEDVALMCSVFLTGLRGV